MKEILFVFLFNRSSPPSYAEFSTLQMNTDFCRPPANWNPNDRNGTRTIQRLQDKTDRRRRAALGTEDICKDTRLVDGGAEKPNTSE